MAIDSGSNPIAVTRGATGDAELDMTPMIDCVFLLLIYFLVGTRPDNSAVVKLPEAMYGLTISAKECVVVSITSVDASTVEIYLADGKRGRPISGTEEEQDSEISNYIGDNISDAKPHVLIKAERAVRWKHVNRIGMAASKDREIKLYLAIMDKPLEE